MGTGESKSLCPGSPHDPDCVYLDLSGAVNPIAYKEHSKGNYVEGCYSDLPPILTESSLLYRRVNLSFNCISSLPEEFPMVLPHLTFLDISHNHLGELPGSFMLFLHLETLLVANNFLKVLPNGMQHLRHLHTLDVSHNRLKELPEDIGHWPSLRKLNISHNSLRELPPSLADTSLSTFLAFDIRSRSPPQSVCESGSDMLLHFLRHEWKKKVSTDSDVENKETLSSGISNRNVFPRVRGNQVMSNSKNPDCARAQYIQAQTETGNLPQKARTPLISPKDATALAPDEFIDRVLGLFYGAVLGDSLGLGPEFLSKDAIEFYFDRETFCYDQFRMDKHRAHWKRGGWTDLSDIMIIVLDSVLHWGGVVDELAFAAQLKAWHQRGWSPTNETKPATPGTEETKSSPSIPVPVYTCRGYISSNAIKMIMNEPDFVRSPHVVASLVHDRFRAVIEEADLEEQKSEKAQKLRQVFLDGSGLAAALTTGVPHFYDLQEVESNALRICKVTHYEPQCQASAIAVAVTVALLLQGKDLASDAVALETILTVATKKLSSSEARHEFEDMWKTSLTEKRPVLVAGVPGHPYTALSTMLVALSLLKEDRSDDAVKNDVFERIMTEILLLGGYARLNGLLCGAVLGALTGFQRLPKRWLSAMPPSNRAFLNGRLNHLLDMMGIP